VPHPMNAAVNSPLPIATPRALVAWRNAVFAIFFVSGLSIATWVSRVPAIRDGLRLNTAEVGILIFGLSAGSVLGLVVAAWLLARFGARRAMTLSILASALGLVAVGAGSTLLASRPSSSAASPSSGSGWGPST
jgi:MFS family permease